jgi:hypothetical protein
MVSPNFYVRNWNADLNPALGLNRRINASSLTGDRLSAHSLHHLGQAYCLDQMALMTMEGHVAGFGGDLSAEEQAYQQAKQQHSS